MTGHHLPLCLTLVVGGAVTVLLYAYTVRWLLTLPESPGEE